MGTTQPVISWFEEDCATQGTFAGSMLAEVLIGLVPETVEGWADGIRPARKDQLSCDAATRSVSVNWLCLLLLWTRPDDHSRCTPLQSLLRFGSIATPATRGFLDASPAQSISQLQGMTNKETSMIRSDERERRGSDGVGADGR